MEYIGENLFIGQLGRFAVSLSFTASIISAIAYILYTKTKDSSYHRFARFSFWAHTVGAISIVLTLFYMMLNHYFEYDYVWKHTSLDLPLRYIFSAFWEGQEGSFILWIFWNSVLGILLMYTAKKWEAGSMVVFSAVQAFLSSMILGVYLFGHKIGSSPFILMREVVDNIGLPWTSVPDYLERFPTFMDGTGLNPLLQNYWMTIHPPTLFLGFASTLPPFAFAIAALLNKDFKSWVKPALPWTFFSVSILGLGILMGGAWAYEALSFGGFWAWDPVENSSLVPWITMVGGAHLLLIYRNKKTGLSAAFFLIIISFLLILYSTFLTRSGVLGDSSVHSFVDLGLSGQLLIYLLSFVVFSFGLLLYRYKSIPKSKKEDDLTSREFWMFIGSLTLLISAFQITFSTSIPVFNALFGPEGWIPFMEDKMAPPLDAIKHYNSFQLPFSIVITLLIALGQFMNYGKSKKKFWFNLLRSFIVSLLVTAALGTYYDMLTDPLYLLLLFVGTFAFFSNLDYWLFFKKANFTFAGSSIAHIGFALIMVGALISNGRQQVISNTTIFLSDDLPNNENAVLDLMDTVDLGPYKAQWTEMEEIGDKQFYNVNYYDKDFQKQLFTLRPFLQITDQMGPSPNPSTKHYWNKDVYTHIQYSSYLEPVSPDGYSNEMELEMERGDSAIFNDHFVIMDSIKVKASYNENTNVLEAVRLTAILRIVNVLGEEFMARPSFILIGNEVTHEDAYLETQLFKFRLDEVNPDTNKMLIKGSMKKLEKEKDFIVMKAIVFPMINLLWIGSILMVLGGFIAVYQRVRR